MMFDEKRVAQIAKQGKAESWPYPKVFHDLKEAGVTAHEVWVEEMSAQTVTYKGRSENDFYIQHIPPYGA